jgi:hypothetical protein
VTADPVERDDLSLPFVVSLALGRGGEDVALKDARGVLAQKLRPGRVKSARRGVDPGVLWDPPDGVRRELED